MLFRSALRHLGAAGKAIAPGNAVPGGLYEKAKAYKGGNGDFTQAFNQYAGTQLTAKVLKQLMKQWRFCLEDQGVRFVNRRSNGRRLVEVFYTPPGDEGDGGDAEPPGSGKSPAAPL